MTVSDESRAELAAVLDSINDDLCLMQGDAETIIDAILAAGWVKRELVAPAPVPLTKEEAIAFRKAWDAKVEAGWAKQKELRLANNF